MPSTLVFLSLALTIQSQIKTSDANHKTASNYLPEPDCPDCQLLCSFAATVRYSTSTTNVKTTGKKGSTAT